MLGKTNVSGISVTGTYNIDSSGTHNVKNYEYAYVQEGTEGIPTITKTINDNTATINAYSINTNGWIIGSTKNADAITVTASELCNSGTLTRTVNGSVSCVGYSTVNVSIPSYTDLS